MAGPAGAEASEAEPEAGAAEVRAGAVHEVRQQLLGHGENGGFLVGGQFAVADCLVEVRLLCRYERRDEPVCCLSLGGCDLGERLAVLEIRLDLVGREAEVGCGSGGVAAEPEPEARPREPAWAAAEAAPAAAEPCVRPVDLVRDLGLQRRKDGRLLGGGELAGADGCVELRLRPGDERRDQPVCRLSLGGCDLGERLAVLEIRLDLVGREAEVGRRHAQVGERADPEGVHPHPAAEAGRADERQRPGLDRRLQLIALGLGQRARTDLGVDLVLLGLHERVRERRRRDSKLIGRVGDDRRALGARGVELRRGNRATRASDHQQRHRAADKLLRPRHRLVTVPHVTKKRLNDAPRGST